MRARRGIRRSRAGLSEAAVAVILLVAGVVIGAIVWAFANSMIGMQQTSADFIVTSVEVRQMSSGQCRIYVNLRNNGGQLFSMMDVEVLGPGGASWSQTGTTLNLPPGQSYSASYAPSCLSGWVAGTPLLVRVTLTTPNNVQVSKNVNVMIQYGA
jgi:uncharacterized protein (TIGR02588 family)